MDDRQEEKEKMLYAVCKQMNVLMRSGLRNYGYESPKLSILGDEFIRTTIAELRRSTAKSISQVALPWIMDSANPQELIQHFEAHISLLLMNLRDNLCDIK